MTAIFPIHAGKERPIAAALKISTDYIKNPEKTDGGEWVTAYAFDPLIVDDDFMFSKNQYALITRRDQAFRNAESTGIILHEAAKRYFDGLGYGKRKSCRP